MKKAVLEASGSNRRTGVPPSPKGRARIKEILEAARSVLIEKDYTHFSLRNIAGCAGIHLANLQYYFPSKVAIIRALVDHVVEDYDARYDERFATLPSLPRPRFVAMLDYLIEDIHDPRTRVFAVQLWALMESSAPDGALLNELYTKHLDRIGSYIAELNPGLSAGVTRQRAAMIAAMMSGMMLMLIEADRHRAAHEPDIDVQMREQLMRIATDP